MSLVAVLDADKEGFLRSTTALIQTIGRAARHVNGTAILFADRTTRAMAASIEESDRRRAVQEAHNLLYRLRPAPISRRTHLPSIDPCAAPSAADDGLRSGRGGAGDRSRLLSEAEGWRHAVRGVWPSELAGRNGTEFSP